MFVEKRFFITTAAPYAVTLESSAEKGGVFRVSVPIEQDRRKGTKK